MESFEDLAKARDEAKKANIDDTQHDEHLQRSLTTSSLNGTGQSSKHDQPQQSKDEHSVVDNSKVSLSEEAPPLLYPLLANNLPESTRGTGDEQTADDDDEEPQLATSFDRMTFPVSALQRNRGAMVGKVGEDGVVRMHKFTLYETTNYFYVVGSNILDSAFRIMKIDRTAELGELNIAEDDIVYTKKETHQILNAIDEGNQSTGGLKLKVAFWGLLGFIRFTGPYYMIVVTKRSQVAMIGGHYIFQVDGTELVSITSQSYNRSRPDRNPEETRFINILHGLDLTRSFYFSYSYDVTRTLQFNITREREALQQGHPQPLKYDHNDMFVWNNHLLSVAKDVLHNPFDWCLSIIHGYVDQSALSVYWGRTVYITIIARRSRFFAGARYLKRGANDLGYVANDVETEQIVSEMLTTSFHAPGPVLFASPNYTSYVQHRGSIPLHWTQDSTGVSPKPDIHLNIVDPFFSAAALHFDNLFQRYGTPIYVLNLVKARERTPRESKLLKEYTTAIDYLNQFLPQDKKIIHHAWDMSRASKSRDQDVIGSLEGIAEDILPKTGFFQNGSETESGLKLQNGIARTNCIDCLDRTNAAQFVIGKKALGYQLQALGVIEHPSVDYDSDAVNLFTHMWHDHGDTIAVQYGGSHLVNTMSTYRKINQWTSQSRDMVESFKRYYNNSFMDSQRQEAYNLFLGNYIWTQGQPMLWDLTTDYYLHHSDPRSMFGKSRPSYRQWYTPSHLSPTSVQPAIWPHEFASKPLSFFDDYWVEYYRPLAISSFKKIFSFKMHSNLRYIPLKSTQDGKYDLSPFRVRSLHDNDDKKPTGHAQRKGVKIVAPSDPGGTNEASSSIDARIASSTSPTTLEPTPKLATLGPWLDAQQQLYGPTRRYTGIIKEPSFEISSTTPNIPPIPPTNPNTPLLPPTKADLALDAFARLVSATLQPDVSEAELREYERYVTHPSKIPLVVSSAIDFTSAPSAFLEYLGRRDYGVEVDEGVEEEYAEFLEVGVRSEGLSVLEEDWEKKRYKRYRQWLRGKSLFKQRVGDGEEVF